MTFWVAGAIVVGGVASSAIGSSAAQNAAQTQANAAQNAQNISQNEFNTITQQEQPFVQGGYGALSQLDYLLGIGSPTGFNASPTQTPTQPGGGSPGAVSGLPNFQGGFGFNYSTPGDAPSYQTGVLQQAGAPGLDPSSGYMIGPGGSIGRGLTGGSPAAAGSISGAPPSAAGGPAGSTAGGFGSLLQPFTADTFKQYSPAYQFQQQQGMQGVLNADTSGQGALSGATLKDLIGYNQNLANTSFNNAFNQYQTQQGNIFSRLSGIAQLGQAAAANTGQQGTALAGQAAQSATNIGTAMAGGQVGSANAITGGLGSITSAVPWLMYGGGGYSQAQIPDEGLGVGG